MYHDKYLECKDKYVEHKNKTELDDFIKYVKTYQNISPNIIKEKSIKSIFPYLLEEIDMDIFVIKEEEGPNQISNYLIETLNKMFLENKYFDVFLDILIDEFAVDLQNKIKKDLEEIGINNFGKLSKEKISLIKKNYKYLFDKCALYSDYVDLPKTSLLDTGILSYNKNVYYFIRNFTGDFSFIPSSIIQELKKLSLHSLDIYKMNNIRLMLPNNYPINNLITEIVNADKLIHHVSRYFGNKKNYNFVLQLLPTDAKKVFNRKIFTVNSVNSAEINFRINSIRIFRKEELLKVLYHELLHLYDFDANYNNISNQRRWDELWAVDTKKLLMYETITETFAELLNLIVNFGVSCENYEKEIEFGLGQTAKILYLSGFTSIEEFLDKNKTNKRIKESTSATCYHIFKTICLINIAEVFVYYKHNKVHKILGLIYNYAHHDDEYKSNINKLIEYLKQNFNKNPELSTGRMTILEKTII